MQVLLATVCVFVILTILLEAFEGLVLPRRISRPVRWSRWFYTGLWSGCRSLARRLPSGLRDDLLATFGPLSVLLLITVWAILLILAFAGLHFALHSPVSEPIGPVRFETYFYFSATTFITLGYGDVAPQSSLGRALANAEAGIGFGFLAIVIAYLPVLYGAFSKREVEIGLLDARASTPPSAGELFLRIGPCSELGDLKELLRGWERWSAELLESHLSYPSLMYWRSQHDRQSWLGTLTTILDTSALLIAAAPSDAPSGLVFQARLTFAMARHAAVDLRLNFDIAPPTLVRLSEQAQKDLFATLRAAGLALDDSPEAHARLFELRSLYEPHLAVLAQWLDLTLPTFAPNPEAHDHWRMRADPRDHFFRVANPGAPTDSR